MEQPDPRSPVFARSEVDVLASPQRVWAVLADIDGWQTWNPAVRKATLRGALESTTPFNFAAGPGSNSCTLTAVDAPRILAWSGHSMGVGHQQSWQIKELSDGCHLSAEQSLSGVLARIFSGRLGQWLQGNLDTWVQLLKLEAEARANEADGSDEPPDTDEPPRSSMGEVS